MKKSLLAIVVLSLVVSGCFTSLLGAAAGSAGGAMLTGAVKGKVSKSSEPLAPVTGAAPVVQRSQAQAVLPQSVPQWLLLDQSKVWAHIIGLERRLDIRDLMRDMLEHRQPQKAPDAIQDAQGQHNPNQAAPQPWD